MTDFLKEWAVNIVIVSIFITLLEIILPKSSMKRYINLITGLLLIIVLINPFIKLITKDISIEREVFKNLNNYTYDSMNKENGLTELQYDQTASIYKEKLKKNISNFIEAETKYNVKDIWIEIVEKENEDFGEIKKLKIILSEGRIKEERYKEKIKVDTVNVNIGTDIEPNTVVNESSIDKHKVINLLAEHYCIHKDTVSIMEEK